MCSVTSASQLQSRQMETVSAKSKFKAALLISQKNKEKKSVWCIAQCIV